MEKGGSRKRLLGSGAAQGVRQGAYARPARRRRLLARQRQDRRWRSRRRGHGVHALLRAAPGGRRGRCPQAPPCSHRLASAVSRCRARWQRLRTNSGTGDRGGAPRAPASGWLRQTGRPPAATDAPAHPPRAAARLDAPPPVCDAAENGECTAGRGRGRGRGAGWERARGGAGWEGARGGVGRCAGREGGRGGAGVGGAGGAGNGASAEHGRTVRPLRSWSASAVATSGASTAERNTDVVAAVMDRSVEIVSACCVHTLCTRTKKDGQGAISVSRFILRQAGRRTYASVVRIRCCRLLQSASAISLASSAGCPKARGGFRYRRRPSTASIFRQRREQRSGPRQRCESMSPWV